MKTAFALRLGGEILSFCPSGEFLPSSPGTGEFASFFVEAPPDSASTAFRIVVSSDKDAPAWPVDNDYKKTFRHWQIGTTFYNGRDFVIESRETGTPENRLLWRTFFNPARQEARTYVAPVSLHPPRLPAVDAFPHFMQILAWRLATRRGAWLHSAGAMRNGRMSLFAGRPDAGKSTLSRLLHQSGAFQIASDENMVTRQFDDGFHAYGTPWQSDAKLCANISAPLTAVYFLKHAPENSITPLSPREALKHLMQQVHVPWFDESMTNGVLQHIEAMIQRIPFFTLAFRPDNDVVVRLIRHQDGLPHAGRA